MKRRSFLQSILGVTAIGVMPKSVKEDMTEEEFFRLIKEHQESIKIRFPYNSFDFILDNPDYSKVVGERGQIAKGKFAKPFRDAIKEYPELLVYLADCEKPIETSYLIAKQYV